MTTTQTPTILDRMDPMFAERFRADVRAYRRAGEQRAKACWHRPPMTDEQIATRLMRHDPELASFGHEAVLAAVKAV